MTELISLPIDDSLSAMLGGKSSLISKENLNSQLKQEHIGLSPLFSEVLNGLSNEQFTDNLTHLSGGIAPVVPADGKLLPQGGRYVPPIAGLNTQKDSQLLFNQPIEIANNTSISNATRNNQKLDIDVHYLFQHLNSPQVIVDGSNSPVASTMSNKELAGVASSEINTLGLDVQKPSINPDDRLLSSNINKWQLSEKVNQLNRTNSSIERVIKGRDEILHEDDSIRLSDKLGLATTELNSDMTLSRQGTGSPVNMTNFFLMRQGNKNSLESLVNNNSEKYTGLIEGGEESSPSNQSSSYTNQSIDSRFVNNITLTSPINSSSWGNEFSDRVRWMVSSNIKQAEMTLNPKNMGKIEINLSIQNDQSTIHFNVQNPHVKDLVDASIVRLRELFDQVGLASLDVDVNLSQSSDSDPKYYQPREQAHNPDDVVNEQVSIINEGHIQAKPSGLIDMYA